MIFLLKKIRSCFLVMAVNRRRIASARLITSNIMSDMRYSLGSTA